jgi:hypothetical protein
MRSGMIWGRLGVGLEKSLELGLESGLWNGSTAAERF